MKKIVVKFENENGNVFNLTFTGRTKNEAATLASNYVSNHPGLYCLSLKVDGETVDFSGDQI